MHDAIAGWPCLLRARFQLLPASRHTFAQCNEVDAALAHGGKQFLLFLAHVVLYALAGRRAEIRPAMFGIAAISVLLLVLQSLA